jgi:hypothetical protein
MKYEGKGNEKNMNHTQLVWRSRVVLTSVLPLCIARHDSGHGAIGR